MESQKAKAERDPNLQRNLQVRVLNGRETEFARLKRSRIKRLFSVELIMNTISGRTGRSSSRGSSGERSPSANPFVRAGTLKAMKEEQDRLRAEEEEREKAKAEKRSKSVAKNVCFSCCVHSE